MRFKLNFKLVGEAPFLLPTNYQNEFSSWIHKMLHFEVDGFGKWAREKGYTDSRGEYRMFTFSDVQFVGHKHQGDRLIVEHNEAAVVLSFYGDPEIEPFVFAIFENKEFKIGDKKGKVAFVVESIEKLQEALPDTTREMTFTCLSPMLIAEPGKTDGPFLSPDQKDFDKIFFKNLMFKYARLIKFMNEKPGNGLANLQDLKFKLHGKPKPRIVKIKTDSPHQLSVKGYVFDFTVKAPVELLNIGYNGGFGELNHLGFGCCGVK